MLELLSLKQGSKPLLEFLDNVRDLVAQGNIDNAVAVTALSQSLRIKFAEPLIARVSSEVAGGRALSLRTAIEYLRELGARTTARGQHALNDPATKIGSALAQGQNRSNPRSEIVCHKCGKKGHIAAECRSTARS